MKEKEGRKDVRKVVSVEREGGGEEIVNCAVLKTIKRNWLDEIFEDIFGLFCFIFVFSLLLYNHQYSGHFLAVLL